MQYLKRARSHLGVINGTQDSILATGRPWSPSCYCGPATELHEIRAKLDELPQWQGRTFVMASIITKMLGPGLDRPPLIDDTDTGCEIGR